MSHVTDWLLGLHGWVVVAVVFALPALESSAFIGFLFPGEIAVLLGGVLAFEHRVALLAVIAAGVLGAIIGDTVGYFVGQRWGRALLHGTIGRIVKHEHLDKAQDYIAAKGGKAVFFGRFTAALRVLIPGLAGMSGMPYGTFALYNVTGGTLWATGFVLLGYVAGNGYRKVEHIAGRASLLLLLLIVVVFVGVVGARWLLRHQEGVKAWATRQLQRPAIAKLLDRYRAQFAFVADRVRPGGALGLSLTLGLALIAGIGWAFGSLLQDVIAHDDLARVDIPVEHFFIAHRELWLNSTMRVVTNLGSVFVLLPLIVVVGGLWWARRRRWRPLLLLGGALAGAVILSSVLKLVVARPRPPVHQMVATFSGLSFPSGHATQAAAVFGMLAALCSAVLETWGKKVALWSGALGVSLVVAASRIYLGVHWLTDVLGGLALGTLWLFVLLIADRTLVRLRAKTDQRGVTWADSL